MASSEDAVVFSGFDYVIFISMLVLSSAIGIYYGFIAKIKQDNTAEYFLGAKQMTLLPIAVSLIVTHISGITMLGIPAEIYAYGSPFWLSFVPALVIPLMLNYVFYPVFYDLKLLSTFMYFERRFNRTIRLIASAAFCCCSIAFMPMYIYAPALAFNQVSGVNVHVVTTILATICVFYTTLGGLRAIIWTDVIQGILMFGAVFGVIILGILNLKYPMDIFSIADDGGRLILFDWNPSPLVRSSVWTVVIGLSFYWSYGFGAVQTVIQKLLSLPDRRTATKAIWIYAVGIIVFNLSAVLIGLILYANIFDCDPLSAGFVRKMDQVVPYFVMQIGAKIPGMPGLFIAGLFSGGLSSMSGTLNTVSCIVYEDFLKTRLSHFSEKTVSSILKAVVLLMGCAVLGLVFVIEHLSTIFELTVAILAVTGGALLGLFTVGMLCRRVNTKGAICGMIPSLLLLLFIVIGSQSAPQKPTLPMRTDGCSEIQSDWNATSIHIPRRSQTFATNGENEVFWMFQISYMYYTMIGCITVWIFSYPISLLTSTANDDETFDENLLAPFMRRPKNIVVVKIELNSEEIKKF